MAERRMFTKKVTDDDNFMSLSASAQALYLHLSMSADDDGFCNQVSLAMFKAHASVQDLEALLSKRYVYQFENGVIVIKHWRMANALRKDRYTPTTFQEEFKKLMLKDNGAYSLLLRLPDGCQSDADCLPQDRLGKDSIDKINNNSTESKSDHKKKTEIVYADVEAIPLNDGTEWKMPLELYEEYLKVYPAVNIKQEIAEMRMWSLSNPTKKKTRSGVTRFINTWLRKTQNNPRQHNATHTVKNSFNDIPHSSSYENMSELEKQLLDN